MDTPKIATSTQNEISADEFTAVELDAVSGGKPGLDRATYEWLKANYFPFMFKTSTRNVC
ncbi:hypothetical protein LJR220_000896 [Bradyrhizobium sp. LjRoot220]|uniref:hypothetical protein n=1 Tax=Bradyrhizobium sp. LjRoot220 TaxID=3342284 RepID=UPI003ECEB751